MLGKRRLTTFLVVALLLVCIVLQLVDSGKSKRSGSKKRAALARAVRAKAHRGDNHLHSDPNPNEIQKPRSKSARRRARKAARSAAPMANHPIADGNLVDELKQRVEEAQMKLEEVDHILDETTATPPAPGQAPHNSQTESSQVEDTETSNSSSGDTTDEETIEDAVDSSKEMNLQANDNSPNLLSLSSQGQSPDVDQRGASPSDLDSATLDGVHPEEAPAANLPSPKIEEDFNHPIDVPNLLTENNVLKTPEEDGHKNRIESPNEVDTFSGDSKSDRTSDVAGSTIDENRQDGKSEKAAYEHSGVASDGNEDEEDEDEDEEERGEEAEEEDDDDEDDNDDGLGTNTGDDEPEPEGFKGNEQTRATDEINMMRDNQQDEGQTYVGEDAFNAKLKKSSDDPDHLVEQKYPQDQLPVDDSHDHHSAKSPQGEAEALGNLDNILHHQRGDDSNYSDVRESRIPENEMIDSETAGARETHHNDHIAPDSSVNVNGVRLEQQKDTEDDDEVVESDYEDSDDDDDDDDNDEDDRNLINETNSNSNEVKSTPPVARKDELPYDAVEHKPLISDPSTTSLEEASSKEQADVGSGSNHHSAHEQSAPANHNSHPGEPSLPRSDTSQMGDAEKQSTDEFVTHHQQEHPELIETSSSETRRSDVHSQHNEPHHQEQEDEGDEGDEDDEDDEDDEEDEEDPSDTIMLAPNAPKSDKVGRFPTNSTLTDYFKPGPRVGDHKPTGSEEDDAYEDGSETEYHNAREEEDESDAKSDSSHSSSHSDQSSGTSPSASSWSMPKLPTGGLTLPKLPSLGMPKIPDSVRVANFRNKPASPHENLPSLGQLDQSAPYDTSESFRKPEVPGESRLRAQLRPPADSDGHETSGESHGWSLPNLSSVRLPEVQIPKVMDKVSLPKIPSVDVSSLTSGLSMPKIPDFGRQAFKDSDEREPDAAWAASAHLTHVNASEVSDNSGMSEGSISSPPVMPLDSGLAEHAHYLEETAQSDSSSFYTDTSDRTPALDRPEMPAVPDMRDSAHRMPSSPSMSKGRGSWSVPETVPTHLGPNSYDGRHGSRASRLFDSLNPKHRLRTSHSFRAHRMPEYETSRLPVSNSHSMLNEHSMRPHGRTRIINKVSSYIHNRKHDAHLADLDSYRARRSEEVRARSMRRPSAALDPVVAARGRHGVSSGADHPGGHFRNRTHRVSDVMREVRNEIKDRAHEFRDRISTRLEQRHSAPAERYFT